MSRPVSSQPLDWLFGLERLGMRFGLESMLKLAAELGDPQQHFPSVLIAGTNGKGSVTALVDTALRAGGYRSARYTSPHLIRLEERFVIDGHEVATAELESAVAKVREAVDALVARGQLSQPATFFECATAAAFVLFDSAAVDIAVLEVGLGGRLDATNIVTPLACAITTIDFDHQAQLGSTRHEIAAEKAGIIKPGVPVVTGRLPAAAEAVIDEVAAGVGAPCVRALESAALPDGARPALAGAHQVDNALVAIALLELLGPHGFGVSESAVRRGLETVEWPGRLERLQYKASEVLLDAAHNPGGARALAVHLRETGWTDATLVFGAMADKDARGMLAELVPATARVICTTAHSPRAEGAAVLAGLASTVAGAGPVEIIEDPALALERARVLSRRVVVAGSIFLIGPLRGILR
jgi:dihydrofolate synthase/folylpolyglutamate synthase